MIRQTQNQVDIYISTSNNPNDENPCRMQFPQVVELDWLRPHATIIASGSDQPTKNEIPAEVGSFRFVDNLPTSLTALNIFTSVVFIG